MKQTIFTEFHKKLGARMVPFAGFSMPLQYSGINDEHIAVRKHVGLFDVSHMGEFSAKGKYAKKLVQLLTSNDINQLSVERLQYSCFINEKGGIVDDLLVYMLAEDEYLLVVNAINRQKDWDWCVRVAQQHGIDPNIHLFDISDNICQLAVQGPNAMKYIQMLTDESVIEMKPFTFKKLILADIENVMLSISGYTGSPGCEIYAPISSGEKLWENMMKVGSTFGVQPCGLGARDTLRIEAGFCLYGNEINEMTTTLEASLGWITKLKDGNHFIGRPAIENLKQAGIQKRLYGFEMIDKGIPRKDYKIFNHTRQKIGVVTSGTMAPYVNKAIGMGYIDKPYGVIDREIFIRVRNSMLKARIVKLPFYKP